MSELLPVPPRLVVVLKLSALGDVCNTLPVVRTLQKAWPQTQFAWVIGRAEARFVGHIPDIEFIVFDKRAGLAAYRGVRQALRGRAVDLLLHMQFAWRASLVASCIPARIKLGYDRERALDLQWLFTNARIDSGSREHVLDALFGFARRAGIHERCYRWDIPVSEGALQFARRAIPDGVPTLIISPCSSHLLRNWHAAGYAAAGDYAARELGLKVLICGGRTPLELAMGEQIAARMTSPCVNMVGQDTLPEFYATLARARLLLTPDSGPAHMATALGIPVVGLYAATNPARSGPYFSLDLCANQFDLAAKKFLGKSAEELPWRTKIERPGVMDLIQTAEVNAKLEAAMARTVGISPASMPAVADS
jgi:heptosyltransferase I